MLNYLQALRDCCRDEAAFMRLQQILAATGQSVEIPECQCAMQAYREPLTTNYFGANLTPKPMALRSGEEGFQRMTANIPGIIFQAVHRSDGSRSLLFASSGCRELFEIEPELAQKDLSVFWNLIHPDDRPIYQKSVADSGATLQPWRWEGRAITKSGKLIWIQCAASPELQDNGDILWSGLIMDITSVKQAEEARRMSEEKFAIAFRSSPDAITICTLSEGRFVEVNDSFLRISGYTRQEAIGRTAGDLNWWVHAEERINTQVILQEQGAIHNQEIEFRNKSGEILTMLCSAEVVNVNGIQCVLAVSSDITKRKAAEAQIRAAAERDRLLGEIALRIRRSLDLDEILHTTVTEIRQFLHADRVFITKFDENGQSRVVAESVDSQWPPIREWVTDDTAYQEIKALFTSDRIRIVCDANLSERSPLLDEYHTRYCVKAGIGVPIIIGERLFGLLIANQCSSTRNWQQFEADLLEQLATQVAIAIQQSSLFKELANLNANLERQVEERTAQLRQKMQELQELHRLKDVVLNTVSHELRTSVLGTIMVFKNLLNLPGENISISRSIVERMVQGNERQLGMIDSLLETHSRQEPGVVLHRECVQFGSLLEEIIKDLQPLLERSSAVLTNQCKTNLPSVMADPTQIKRVLENLFNHVLTSNPPGLHLTLKAKVEAGTIRCTIQDNGAGMSKIERDRLFDLYVRDPQGKCSTAVGMKLYLCRKIIQAHGGQIGVNSSPKRGSAFWFTLPISQPMYC